MSASTDLADLIANMERRIEQLDRRLNNIVREARVTEVDLERGLVKVEAHELVSAWSPWVEHAGAIRSWTPPSVGQRVMLMSPSGEPGQGIVYAGGYSDQFAAPSNDADAHIIKVGELTLTWRKDKAIINLEDGGKVEVEKDFVRGQLGDARFVASGTVAKVRKGDSWVVCTGGEIIVSSPPVFGNDPDEH